MNDMSSRSSRELLRALPLLLVLALGVACEDLISSTDTNPDATPDLVVSERSGPIAFMEADPAGNAFACASCHDLSEPSSDGLRRPGHPMNDVTARPDFKNGQLSTMLEAVNTCREEWMAAPPWAATDPTWENMQTWLATEGNGLSAAPISFTITDATEPDLSGNVSTGQTLFNASCAACHGQNALGTILAPPLDGALLEDQGGAAYITRRVRTSGLSDSPTYDGLTGGRMPFWSLERLSNQEMAHLNTFLMQHDLADFEDSSGSASVTGFDEIGDCSADHPNVGASADLDGKFHGVAGTVNIVNDCTVQLENFSFDGQGIDVRLYTGTDGDFDSGISIGPDLRRAGGYNGDTLYFILPESVSLDDFNSLSIWCVPAAVDFGSTTFAP